MNTRFYSTTFSMLAAGALLSAGCERREDTGTPTGVGTTTPDADNTARNARDRDMDTQTPIDQGQSSADIRITAEIRRAILDIEGMSIKAQNVKIVTENGVVTLRGPVDSQAEKDSIERVAKSVAGVSRVDNQLEVTSG